MMEESKGEVEQIDTSSKGLHGSPSLQKSKSKPLTEEEVKKGHCNHGPNARCINCLGVTKDNIKEINTKCTHPPNQKCPNCLIK